jgi:hypothetical protein
MCLKASLTKLLMWLTCAIRPHISQRMGVFRMITINITKAKTIAHDKRREARSAEFAPLDIKATIPSEATAAEAARQAVRDKYATMQTAIDAATTTDAIKAAMP